MSKRLFVGNLPYTASESELQDLFSKAGNVDSVAVIVDRDTRQGKGFAFVEMATEEEAKKAIEMFDGYKMGERALVVNEARPKEDRGDRGFRNGRNERSKPKFREYRH